jgi:hypothetical protein
MGGSYRQCSDCGKRALSIATRCPGCGRELPAPAAPHPAPALDLRRFLPARVVAGITAVTVVVTAGELVRTSLPQEQESSFVEADSSSAYSEMAYAIATMTRLDTATAAALPSINVGQLLVARDWTSVRKSRRKGADLEAVLMPGDTVLADSLERGWYRVALEGEVLGYAHRSTLAGGD